MLRFLSVVSKPATIPHLLILMINFSWCDDSIFVTTVHFLLSPRLRQRHISSLSWFISFLLCLHFTVGSSQRPPSCCHHVFANATSLYYNDLLLFYCNFEQCVRHNGSLPVVTTPAPTPHLFTIMIYFFSIVILDSTFVTMAHFRLSPHLCQCHISLP